jgi:hypothetical protein
MGGAFSTHGTDEKFVLNFGRKGVGKRQLGRPWRRRQDNIRTDLTEIGWGGVDCLRKGTSFGLYKRCEI